MNLYLPILVVAAALAASQAPNRPPAAVSFDQIAKRAAEARQRDQLEEAIKLYRQAVRLRPSYDEGWWYLSTILYDLDRYEEARETLRRFISLRPKAGPGWAMLGLCEFELREYERSLQHLMKGQSLGFGDFQQLRYVARYHLELLLTRFERFEEGSLILAALVLEGKESPAIIEALGLNVLRMPYLPSELPSDKRELVLKAGRATYDALVHRTEEAYRGYQELVGRYPQEPNVHYAFGVFLLKDHSEEALREFRREIELFPNHVAARLQIALEYIKRGQFDPALPFAEEAVKLAPRDFAARRTLGRILLVKGDTVRAVQELEAAVKLAPGNPETHYALATAYERVGRKEDAQRERAEFARLGKEEPK